MTVLSNFWLFLFTTFQMDDITCPTLQDITSDYGSRDNSDTRDMQISAFCTVYSTMTGKALAF